MLPRENNVSRWIFDGTVPAGPSRRKLESEFLNSSFRTNSSDASGSMEEANEERGTRRLRMLRGFIETH